MNRLRQTVLLIIGFLLVRMATATTCTWTGNWSTPPSANDDVIIVQSGGNLTWSNELSATVASWTQENSYTNTVTFDTVYTDSGFTNFTITGDCVISNGTWTHKDNSTGNVYRLHVTVEGSLTIESNGTINADAIGYDSYLGPGKATAVASGGGYGGEGGCTGGGATYGSILIPVDCGSGGSGSTGGGAVYLVVTGTTTINGVIRADGGIGVGGGAGGSIYLRTGFLAGNGSIHAKGGPMSNGWTGGGGGRVTVDLTNSASFGSVSITAFPNVGGNHSRDGAPGTVLRVTPSSSELRVDANTSDGTTAAGTAVPTGQTWQGFTDLIVTNFGHVKIPATSTLNIVSPTNIVGDNRSAMITVSGNLTFGQTITNLNGGNLTIVDDGVINLSNKLTVANCTYKVSTSTEIDGGDLVVATNATVSLMKIGAGLSLNSLTVRGGGTVTHEPNTTIEQYKLDLTITNSLTVEANGRIDVGGRGLTTGLGKPSSTYSGGCYGGVGGADTEGDAGNTYGSITNPVSSSAAVPRDRAQAPFFFVSTGPSPTTEPFLLPPPAATTAPDLVAL